MGTFVANVGNVCPAKARSQRGELLGNQCVIILGLDFSEVNLENFHTPQKIWLVDCDQAIFNNNKNNNSGLERSSVCDRKNKRKQS